MASDPEVGPLDPALAPIVDEERGARTAPAGSRARVLARLDASLGGGLTGAPPAAPPTQGPGGGSGTSGTDWFARGVALVTFVAGIAVGAAWSPRAHEVPVEVRTAPSHAPNPIASLPPAPASASELPTPAVQSAVPPSAAPASASAARPLPDRDDLAQERSLLDAARTALLRGDATSTLTMLQKHSARFPKGRLAEERDAMTVQALVLAGRADEARAQREAFERRYPQSLFLPSVRAASSANGKAP